MASWRDYMVEHPDGCFWCVVDRFDSLSEAQDSARKQSKVSKPHLFRVTNADGTTRFAYFLHGDMVML